MGFPSGEKRAKFVRKTGEILSSFSKTTMENRPENYQRLRKFSLPFCCGGRREDHWEVVTEATLPHVRKLCCKHFEEFRLRWEISERINREKVETISGNGKLCVRRNSSGFFTPEPLALSGRKSFTVPQSVGAAYNVARLSTQSTFRPGLNRFLPRRPNLVCPLCLRSEKFSLKSSV